MKFVRIVAAALMVGVLLGGHSATTSLAATKSKSKEPSVLSKVTTGTKNFFGNLFHVKKTTTKKAAAKKPEGILGGILDEVKKATGADAGDLLDMLLGKK